MATKEDEDNVAVVVTHFFDYTFHYISLVTCTTYSCYITLTVFTPPLNFSLL